MREMEYVGCVRILVPRLSSTNNYQLALDSVLNYELLAHGLSNPVRIAVLMTFFTFGYTTRKLC